jgi:dolichol-phosphate mannosyltransferase
VVPPEPASGQDGSAVPDNVGGVALAVVIPVHNEVANIGALINEVVRALRGKIDFEIIVADDASDDGTVEALMGIRANAPELRVLRHARQSGQSAGVLTGTRASRATWIATIDGDGQNDPADILKLVARRDTEGTSRPLLVAGRRAIRRDTLRKRVQSRIANAVRSRLLGDQTPDTGCGLKLFPRAAFLTLPHFDHFHRFLPALFIWAGGQVVSEDVSHRPRAGGRSHYGMWGRLRVGIVDLLGVMWLQRRHVVVEAEEQPANEELGAR